MTGQGLNNDWKRPRSPILHTQVGISSKTHDQEIYLSIVDMFQNLRLWISNTDKCPWFTELSRALGNDQVKGVIKVLL
jgi:hypothetical protein